ncbi:MAG: hypothetical protein E7526_00555 [Ruminococcaceae bacterium]|nr:hypothetical protein [Oscillospiraceae bacterium]
MNIFSVITIILLCVYVILLLLVLKKHQKNIKFLFCQAVVSIIFMAIINLTNFATGLYIPINECTVLGVSLGGIPMIFCFLLLRFIFVL